MDITISWNSDKSKLVLPVNPSELMIGGTMNNTSVEVADFGEVNLKGKRSLLTFSVSSFFPSQPYPFSKDKSSSNNSYSKYIKTLFQLFNNNTTLHVVVSGTNINSNFTMESFTYGHNDCTKDVAYTIDFKQYKNVKSSNVKRATTKKVVSKTVTWKKGYTWQSVTKSVLGKSDTWKTQRKNNSSVIKNALKKPLNKTLKKGQVISFIGTDYETECWALQNYKVTIKG